MELIKNNTQWFLSAQGQETFEKCNGIEERAVFIYSYLKTIAAESLEKDSFLFRMAFLLADAVHSSNTEYAAFPALLDGAKNPFIAYVKNAKKVYDQPANFSILLSILHGIADPFDTGDWIYDQAQFKDNAYVDILKNHDKCFIETSEANLIGDEPFEIEEALRGIQIEIAWLFILAKKEGK